MSVEENLRILKSATDASNARDWDRFEKVHAESVVVYSPPTYAPTKDLARHIEFAKGLVTAFPDSQITEERTFGQGDRVCLEFLLTGTHEGPLQGPGGQTIPATNKPVRLPFCIVFKFEAGEVTEEREYYDLLGMMAQLGLAP